MITGSCLRHTVTYKFPTLLNEFTKSLGKFNYRQT